MAMPAAYAPIPTQSCWPLKGVGIGRRAMLLRSM
jgi:hypothetical protein